jgi:glycosyltransferase involved in cell wall biosynthesis
MLHYATRQARVVLTDSQHSKQDLIMHFRVPAEKIQVIFPAADEQCRVAAPAQTAQAVLRRYGITPPYIFYVGKHHPYKNIKTLLQAYISDPEIYTHAQLVIAGKREARRQELYALAEATPCRESIIFTDLVPETDLFTLYQQAHLFVFPSCYEGFGLPPLEAMASGVPVITSNAASLPEVVGDAAIQVAPYDISGFAAAMHAVLTDPALWASLRARGLQRAQHFSWQTAAQQLLTVYQSMKCRHEDTKIRKES